MRRRLRSRTRCPDGRAGCATPAPRTSRDPSPAPRGRNRRSSRRWRARPQRASRTHRAHNAPASVRSSRASCPGRTAEDRNAWRTDRRRPARTHRDRRAPSGEARAARSRGSTSREHGPTADASRRRTVLDRRAVASSCDVSDTPKIVITLPAYHAARTLERTVAAIPEGIDDELILVDDASRDETADIARRLGLRVHVHPTNRGYGGNQKSCYRLALEGGADIVVLLHPDYQYEPKAVPLLIAPILAGEADMTFGSRFAGMGDPIGGGMPIYRFAGNRITTVAQNLLLGTRFTDMHSGMRAYTRRALLSLPFLGYPEGFSFDAALLVDAVTTGLRVVEVPIPTRYTKESS